MYLHCLCSEVALMATMWTSGKQVKSWKLERECMAFRDKFVFRSSYSKYHAWMTYCLVCDVKGEANVRPEYAMY